MSTKDIPVNDQASAPAATCCGQRYCGAVEPAQVGKPIAATCMLCPASPTYWRRGTNEFADGQPQQPGAGR